MSNDRFLTRVFDTQERRMMYVNNYYPHPNGIKFPNEAEDVSGEIIHDVCYENFLGCTAEGILVSYDNSESATVVFEIPFGDRFIPMTCPGYKECHETLLYESDIVESTYYPIDLSPVKITNGIIKVVNYCFDVYENDEFICELYDLNNCLLLGNIYEGIK